MSVLFTPYRVGSLELRNRIVIAPMCQYPLGAKLRRMRQRAAKKPANWLISQSAGQEYSRKATRLSE